MPPPCRRVASAAQAVQAPAMQKVILPLHPLLLTILRPAENIRYWCFYPVLLGPRRSGLMSASPIEFSIICSPKAESRRWSYSCLDQTCCCQPAAGPTLKIFEPLLLTEVLPAFEERYRVEQRPQFRAIAGVSLGGGLAFSVGFRHPETFRWLVPCLKENLSRGTAAPMNDQRKSMRPTNSIWLACGSGDGFLAGARKFSELLSQKRVKHAYRERLGLHNFATFREQLIEFLPLLFW